MVTLEDARRVIAAAEQKAAEIGQPMNIAVVDGGGNLVSHVRMDGHGSAVSISRLTRPLLPALSISQPRTWARTPNRAGTSTASMFPIEDGS